MTAAANSTSTADEISRNLLELHLQHELAAFDWENRIIAIRLMLAWTNI